MGAGGERSRICHVWRRRPQTSPAALHLRRIRFSSKAVIVSASSSLALPSETRRIGRGRGDYRVRVRP